MIRRFRLAIPLIAALWAAPVSAAVEPVVPPPMTFIKAREAVHTYLKSVPNLPPDVVVVPATGSIPWPAAGLKENVVAEVWTVATNDPEKPRVLMMFAVRPDTGEVYALFLKSLAQQPTYGR